MRWRCLFPAAACSLLAAASLAPLCDRDEPRYAQAVREMRDTGKVLLPTNFGRLRADKPILLYWLQLASTAVCGENELGLRLPSLLALGLWLWVTARLARALVGEERWALLPGMAVAGVFATPDALVSALTAASLLAFVVGARRGQQAAVALGWGLCGLGVLAKGPVTPLFLLPTLAGYCWSDKALWRRLFPPWGVLLALGLVAAWFVPANLESHWELARIALGRHVVQRALEPLEGHGVAGLPGVLLGPPFYLASLAVASFPLAGGVFRFFTENRQQDPQLFRAVALGLGVPFLVLCLVQTKLPHYMLPALPLVVVAARPSFRASAAAALASTVLALGFLGLASQTPYRAAGRAVAALPAPAFAFSMQEPSLRFYARGKLAVGEVYDPSFCFLLLREGEQARVPAAERETLQLRQAFSGWNLAKGKREKLLLYAKACERAGTEKPGPGGSVAESGTGLGRIFAAK